jgi:hypothetical protein
MRVQTTVILYSVSAAVLFKPIHRPVSTLLGLISVKQVGTNPGPFDQHASMLKAGERYTRVSAYTAVKPNALLCVRVADYKGFSHKSSC